MFDIANRAKPVVKWAGGKSTSLSQILGHFPKAFDRYVEPFAGGGAVFLTLAPGSNAAINDTNAELIALYRTIQKKPELLMKKLDALSEKYSQKFFLELRGSTPSNELDIAARFLFLNKTCFNGLYRLNSKGQFNSPFGHKVTCPALYDPDNLLQVSRRLENTKLTCQDFGEVLEDAGKGDFVYCDPPYVPLSKTACFASYTKHGFSLESHEKLCALAVKAAGRGATVAISNSSSPLVKKIFTGFKIHSTQARRAINCKGASRGNVGEVLVLITRDQVRKKSQNPSTRRASEARSAEL